MLKLAGILSQGEVHSERCTLPHCVILVIDECGRSANRCTNHDTTVLHVWSISHAGAKSSAF